MEMQVMSKVFSSAWRAVLAGAMAAGVASSVSAADYTLLVEPSFPANQIRPVYGPLISYLNRSTGHRFQLRTAPNFNQHWRDIRAGARADFVFEEGHFFDYRNKRSGFVGLARTQENSTYVIAVADPEIADEGRDGVVGRTVASIGGPNLGYVLVFSDFRNPLAQPEIRSISTKWSDGPDLVFAGDAEGTLVPAYLAAENPALMEVWRSQELPGRVFSAAPSVPEDVRRSVREALLKLHEDADAYAVVTELRTERMIAVDRAAYDGMERLLLSTFGYVPPVRDTAAAPVAAPTALATATPAADEPVPQE